MSSEPERNEVVYVTAGAQVGKKLILDLPHGLIPPPFIDTHQPLVGTVTFFSAQGYGLPVPE